MCQELNSEITQLDTEADLMGWSYDVLWARARGKVQVHRVHIFKLNVFYAHVKQNPETHPVLCVESGAEVQRAGTTIAGPIQPKYQVWSVLLRGFDIHGFRGTLRRGSGNP